MILCCNGIRFFSIRITSYPLKKQILTTADLASSTCNKTQQYLSILLLPTERRAYNTSSFLYPDTVLTAFGNSRQYTGFSESKDGTHIVTAVEFTCPDAAHHALEVVQNPVPCVVLRVLRRRTKRDEVVECILVPNGDILHPFVQSGGNISLALPEEFSSVWRGLLGNVRQSRTTAQILQDVPPLAGGWKIPAGRGRRNRTGRVIIIGGLECGITVEVAAIGADMLAISVTADVVVVIGFRPACCKPLIHTEKAPRLSCRDILHSHDKAMDITFSA